MIYSFDDVDLGIQVIRRYALARQPIPLTLMTTIELMTKDDLRLSLFFHHRVLRYPSLKRVLFETPTSDVEESAQDDGDPELQVTHPRARPEQMLTPPPLIIPEAMYR